jgi:hypothetical protein
MLQPHPIRKNMTQEHNKKSSIITAFYGIETCPATMPATPTLQRTLVHLSHLPTDKYNATIENIYLNAYEH